MPKDLFDLDDSLLEEAAPKKVETSSYEVELKKARALCIRGQYDRALDIYNSILDEDFENEEALIGVLRVHSKDFTEFDNKDIDQDIHAIESMCPDTMNDEYLSYLKKRKDALATKKVVKPVEEVKPVVAAAKPVEKPKTTTSTVKKTVTPAPAKKVETAEEIFAKEYKKMTDLYWVEKYSECGPSFKKWADTLPTSKKEKSTSAFRYGYITHDTDPKTALYYYKLCFTNSVADPTCVPHALYNSALLLRAGKGGVSKDLNTAIAFLQKAADLGHEKSKAKIVEYQKELKASTISSSDQAKIDEAKSLLDLCEKQYKDRNFDACQDSYFKLMALEITLDGLVEEKVADYRQRAQYFFGCALRGNKLYNDAEKELKEYIVYAEKTNDFELRFAYWELAMLYRYDKPDTWDNKHEAYVYYSKGAALGSEGCKKAMNELSKYR